MDAGVEKIVKDGGGNTLIFTALLAAITANILPVPTDALYFRAQQRDKSRLENGEITPKQYWTRDILGYYSYTALWYIFLFTILQAVGGDYKNKARILMILLSGGLVIGVAQKNISRDEELEELKKQQQAALAKKLGVSACALSTTAPPVSAIATK